MNITKQPYSFINTKLCLLLFLLVLLPPLCCNRELLLLNGYVCRTVLILGAQAWRLEQLTECQKYLKGQGISSRTVQFGTCLIDSKTKMTLFDFMFVAVHMMFFYVAAVFVSESHMFEYGCDAARMMVLVYVAVLFGFGFRMFEWGFDAAQFGLMFLLRILRMLLRYLSYLGVMFLLLCCLYITYCCEITFLYNTMNNF